MSNKNDNNSTKHRLGVVAISYNEERDLESFISHLLPWVDEIVIIDDGSSDRTAEIAATGMPTKVKFIPSPRNEGEFFSHQRNKGIAVSSCDWLLHMDIDERVTPELAKEIMTAVRDESKVAYRFRRLNYFLHRPMHGGGWQDWNLVHLAKSNILRFSGMYHEKCIIDTPPENIGQLKEKMWHLNDESYKERMGKSFLYCQEQAAILTENGTQIRWWHLLLMPLKEFIAKLVKKRGYRDGTLGLLFALHAACAMFRAYALVWDEQNRLDRSDIENELRDLWSHSGNNSIN
jgi:glycosyltransferase involved in cell wall biosynthesis